MATHWNYYVLMGLGLLLSSCASGGEDPLGGPTGTLQAALNFDGPGHDVVAVDVTVYAGVEDCAAPDLAPVAGASPGMEAEFLPLYLEGDPPAGDMHPFADALFVLAPGVYTVCAVPLGPDGVPSEHCAPTSQTAEVLAEQTTEILLYSQCLGDPTGALDVIVALNDPPHIDDLLIEPSKFITVCESATFTVVASDPNGDALTYTWIIAQGDGPPLALPETGPTASITPPSAGQWSITVIVDDGHGATASMNFPLHVSDADCGEPSCGDEQCDDSEDCQTCPGDCGPCGPFCGDDVCDDSEDCQTCPGDCGPCGPVCGDGVCEDPEDCQTCPGDCGPCGPVCGDGVCEDPESCVDCSGDCGPCIGQCIEGIILDPTQMDSPVVTSFDELPNSSNTPFATGGVDFLAVMPPEVIPLLPPGFPITFLGGFTTTGFAIPGLDGDPFLASTGGAIVMEPLGDPSSFGFAWGDQNFGPGTAMTVRFFMSDGTVVESASLQPPDFGFIGLNTCDPALTVEWVVVGGPGTLPDGTPVQSADFGVDDIHCNDCTQP